MKNKRTKGAFLFVPILLIAIFGTFNPAHAQVIGEHNSDNWSGYTTLGSGFTKVQGTWIVPAVTPTSSTGIEADTTWVGIGGVNNWNLIQAGTEAIVINGRVEYHSWYELLPDVSIPTPLSVSPGHSVTTVISETSPNNWFIEIKNNTTGQSWSKTVYYESTKSSAEWIQEAPSHDNSVLPIDDFKSVTFTNAYTVRDGITYAANDLPVHAMILTDNSGKVLATPTSFITNSSFGVNAVLKATQPTQPTVAPTPVPVPAQATVVTSPVAQAPVVQTYTTDTTSYVPIQTPGQVTVTTSRAGLLTGTVTVAQAYIVPVKSATAAKRSVKKVVKKIVKKKVVAKKKAATKKV